MKNITKTVTALSLGLMIMSSSANAAFLYENPVTQTFPVIAGYASPQAAVGDIDDDGRDDIVFGRSMWSNAPGSDANSTAPLVIRKNGVSGFTDISTSIFVTQPQFKTIQKGIVIADFNGDNKNDLFVADFGPDFSPYPGSPNRLFLKNGSGKLEEKTATNLPVNLDGSYQASAADIDNDGDIDIFITGYDSTSPFVNYFLINDGTGILH